MNVSEEELFNFELKDDAHVLEKQRTQLELSSHHLMLVGLSVLLSCIWFVVKFINMVSKRNSFLGVKGRGSRAEKGEVERERNKSRREDKTDYNGKRTKETQETKTECLRAP